MSTYILVKHWQLQLLIFGWACIMYYQSLSYHTIISLNCVNFKYIVSCTAQKYSRKTPIQNWKYNQFNQFRAISIHFLGTCVQKNQLAHMCLFKPFKHLKAFRGLLGQFYILDNILALTATNQIFYYNYVAIQRKVTNQSIERLYVFLQILFSNVQWTTL